MLLLSCFLVNWRMALQQSLLVNWYEPKLSRIIALLLVSDIILFWLGLLLLGCMLRLSTFYPVLLRRRYINCIIFYFRLIVLGISNCGMQEGLFWWQFPFHLFSVVVCLANSRGLIHLLWRLLDTAHLPLSLMLVGQLLKLLTCNTPFLYYLCACIFVWFQHFTSLYLLYIFQGQWWTAWRQTQQVGFH
jgi:hypothetical protein